MLGSDLTPLLDREGISWNGFDINHDDGQDIQKREIVSNAVEDFQPDWIIHLAAATDVDQCEKEPKNAFRINFLGTKNLVLAAKKVGANFLYVSTSSVFDGSKPTPYNEFDLPSPISQYGKSKFAAEQYVAAHIPKHIIVRAGWMFGGVQKDKKFVGKIIDLLKVQDKITAVSDKFGSPTYTKDFSELILQLIKLASWGIYHGANSGYCSRKEMASEIVRIMNLETEVIPVSSAMYPLPAPRPRMEAIENWALIWEGIPKMRSWQDALRAYVETNRSKFRA